MRRAALLAALALAALLLPAAASGDEAPAPTVVPCNDLPVVTTAGELGLLEPCAPGIRPGAKATNACTLGWVLTDGTELYITAAGHCAPLGRRVHVEGLGFIGTVVHSRSQLSTLQGDWALIRIDAEDRPDVEPTLCRWDGANDGPFGTDVRTPLPGEVVLHYGHGVVWRDQEETRGRAGVALYPAIGAAHFAFGGIVSVGDSGSPVRLATGEAAGIAVGVSVPTSVTVPGVATIPVPVGGLVVASRLTDAIADFESVLGVDLALVQGDAAV